MVYQKKYFEALKIRFVVIKGSFTRAFYDNKSTSKSFKNYFFGEPWHYKWFLWKNEFLEIFLEKFGHFGLKFYDNKSNFKSFKKIFFGEPWLYKWFLWKNKFLEFFLEKFGHFWLKWCQRHLCPNSTLNFVDVGMFKTYQKVIK